MMHHQRAKGAGTNGVSRFLATAKNAFFQVLFLSNKKNIVPHWRSYVNVATRIVQLFAFLVSSNVGSPWPPAIVWLTTVSSVFNLTILQTIYRSTVYVALYYCAVALVVILLALLLFGMVSFARNSFSALWPLRLLRFLGNLAAGPLFIPVLQMLSSVLACNQHISPSSSSSTTLTANDPTGSAFTCSGGGYVVQLVLSIVLAACLFLFALTFVGVFFESHPLSASLESKAHGRADILLLFVQAVLVLAVETFSQRIALWLLLTLLGVGGAIWFLSFLYFLPHYHHSQNCLNVAGATGYLWLFICLLINNLYPEADVSLMVYCGLPFAVATGWSITTWRANKVINSPASRLSGPFEVELKARFTLHTALHGHPLHKIAQEAMSPALAAFQAGVVKGLATSIGSTHKGQTGKKSEVGEPGADGGAAADANAQSTLERDGFNANMAAAEAGLGGAGGAAGPTGGGGGTAAGGAVVADHESDSLDDLDERAAALRRLIPPSVLAEVATLYRTAASRMRTSALIFLFQSRFCGAFLGNKHLQTSALLAAERRKPALDVAFLVYQARRANEDSSASGGGGVEMSALARISYEKHSAEARRNVLLAAQRQAAFWNELLDAQPDLSRLHRLSSETSAAVAAAENAFTELSAINNQSIAVIRLYAAFNLIVLGNAEKASILTAEADRLEDAKAKDHRAEGQQRLSIMAESSLDLWAENTALLTISARTQDLGLILSANSSALKTFGYSRLQLERRSAFTLLPPPLDAWTEVSLKKYTAFGAEGNECVGHARVVFVAGKSGAIFPALSSIRDAPSESADGNRAFLWIIRELRSSTSFILCNPAFGILAGCASSLSLLHLEPSALSNREVTLLDFCKEMSVKSVVDELAGGGASAGFPIRIDVTVGHEEDSDDDDDGLDADDGYSANGDAGSDTGDDDKDGRSGGMTSRSRQRASPTPNAVTRMLSRRTGSRSSRQEGGFVGSESSRQGTLISVWVRAHLQRIIFDGLSLWVLQWTRVPPNESHAITKAEARRTAVLQKAGLVQSQEVAVVALPPSKMTANLLSPMPGSPLQKVTAQRLPPITLVEDTSASSPPSSGRKTDSNPSSSVKTTPPPGIILPGQLGQKRVVAIGSNQLTSPLPARPATAAARRALFATNADKTGVEGTDLMAMLETGDEDSSAPLLPSAVAVSSPSKDSPPSRASTLDADDEAAKSIGGSAIELAPYKTRESPAGPMLEKGGSFAVGEREPVESRQPRPLKTALRQSSFPRVTTFAPDDSPAVIAGSGQSVNEGAGGGGSAGAPSKKSGRGGGNSSVGSGSHGSKGSGTSLAARNLNRLRKSISVEHQPLLKGLWWLMVVGVLLTLLAVGLAVMVVVVTRRSFLDFSGNLDYVTLGADRLLAKSSALRSLQDLMYHARGIVTLNATDIASHRSYVLGNTTLFVHYHKQMYNLALAANMRDWGGEYIPITRYDVPPKFVGGNILYMGMFDAGAYLARQMERAASFSMAQFADLKEPTLMQLLIYDAMRDGVLHETLAQSGLQGYALTLEAKDNIVLFVSTIIASMCSLVLVIALCIFLPILRSVDKSADRIVLNFVALPQPVKAAMSAQMAGRMKTLRRQYAADDDDDDWDDSDEDSSTNGNGALFIGNDVSDGSTARGEGAGTDNEVDWKALLQQTQTDPGSGRRSARASRASDNASGGAPGAKGAAAPGTSRYRPTVKPLLQSSASASVMPSPQPISSSRPELLTDRPPSSPKRSTGPPFQMESSQNGSSSAALLTSSPQPGAASSTAAPLKRTPSVRGSAMGVSLSAMKTGVTHRKSSRAFTLLVLRFLGPLVALFVLFAIIEIAFLSTMANTTTLISISAAANERASCSRDAAVNLRKLSYITTDSAYIINTHAFTMDSFKCVSWHNRLLGLGKPPTSYANTQYAAYTQPIENGLSSGLLTAEESALVHGAMYDDACVFLRDYVYNDGRDFDIDACYEYNGGVLKRGLAAALLTWHRDAERVADRQLRGTYTIGNLTRGLGWLISEAAFNYDGVQCKPELGCRLGMTYSRPADDSNLPPTPVSNLSFIGEWPANVVPGGPGGPPADSVPYSIGAEQKEARMQRVMEGDGLYMTPALFEIASFYSTTAHDEVDTFLTFLVAFTSSYMSLFLIGFLFSFIPNIKKTNDELISKRSLLLYLPPVVIARTPSLHALIDEILSADVANAAGSAGSSSTGGGGKSPRLHTSGSDAGSVGSGR